MSAAPVTCLIAAPDGDIVPQGDLLALPLEGCPAGVSYAEYFAGIEAFLAGVGGEAIERLTAESGDAVTGIVVRAEKHGALYHPASLELRLRSGAGMRLALAVATSGHGRDALCQEHDLLVRLSAATSLPWLPRARAFHAAADMSFLLEEWFDGFHEFHATGDGGIVLWAYGQGLRRLTPEQSAGVFRRIGAILADYYDVDDGSCIRLWHLAAGDFIARDTPEPEVRLCTVRGYGPFLDVSEGCPPVLALLLFFLDTTLRVRLDRLDGTGDTVWLGEALLHAAIAGVCEGLRRKGRADADPVALARLFCSFEADELGGVLAALEDGFGPRDLDFIAPRLGEHLLAVHSGLSKACDLPSEK